MEKKNNQFWWWLITPVSFVLSFYAMAWMFGNKTVGMLALVYISLHEIGHAMPLLAFGIPINMVFVPFFGAGVMPRNIDKYLKLHWLKGSIVVLMGPAVNLTLMIVSIFFVEQFGVYALISISINLSLAVFNLLPIGFLDGGRFVTHVMNSLDENGDTFVKNLVIILSGLWYGYSLIFKGSYIYAMLIFFFIRKAADADDPMDAYSPKAMSRSTAMFLTACWLVVLFGLMALEIYVPSIFSIMEAAGMR